MIPILLMVRELNLGGTERQLTETAKFLDRSQFEPHVGCFHPGGIRAEELKAAGVPIVQLPVRSLYGPSTLSAAREMGRYLLRHRIQLVHTFDVPSNLFGIPTARAFRAPIVVSSQRAYRTLTPGLPRHLLRITDHLVDSVVVNCEAMRRHLIEDENVPASLIRVCHNGVDLQEFHPAARQRPPSLEGASFVIGTVCALRPEKGLDLLLPAFKQVSPFCRNLKLAIVGSGPLLPALEAQSQRLGIREKCVFEPGTRRVPDWLRAMDIFVLPSRSEAMSNSLMEAMACGCAVVASRVGGNPELVQDGRTGLLFESGNVPELAAALHLLMEREALRKALALAGTALIREKFSIAAAAHRMSGIYSALAGKRL